MGNSLAYLMLVIWPAVCLALFIRQPIERALIWSILGAYLVLPPLTEFDLPLVPDLNKHSIPSLAVLAVLMLFLRERPALWPPGVLTRFLILAMLAGTAAGVLTNSEPIVFGAAMETAPISVATGAVPGLRWLDLFSVVSNQLIMLIPFVLARHYLASETGLRELLIAFVIAGLAYSLPALVEVRLSPQINVWTYGFFQHSFAQMMRGDGFRPIVYLPHALWLALFFVICIGACAALARATAIQDRWRYVFAMLYLIAVLILCKSLASKLYVLFMVPVIFLAPAHMQIRFALTFAVIAVSYPILRNLHLVPLDWILQQAAALSPDRAASLSYRFNNEELLLTHAAEKPWFGWGGWGRNLLRDVSGDITTIPDGRWIVIFGTSGWVGYLTQMGLVALPIATVAYHIRRSAEASPLLAPATMILGICMIDLLLNDTMVPISWLMVGAVLGYAEKLAQGAPVAEKPGAAVEDRAAPTSRRTIL